MEYKGWWKWSSTGDPISHLNSALGYDLTCVYSNLWGRKLTGAAIDNWPFIEVLTNPDGSLHPNSGIDFNIINTIADKLNFT